MVKRESLSINETEREKERLVGEIRQYLMSVTTSILHKQTIEKIIRDVFFKMIISEF
jgi:hypothetical protein